MLKMLENKMNPENEKWLEKQLKSEPYIAEDDFVSKVMDQVDADYSKVRFQRKIILFSTYAISIVIFLFATPWKWFTEQIIAGRTEILNTFNNTNEMQTPFMTVSIIFIITFFVIVLGLEQRN